MKVREISDLVDRIYVIEDGEGKWLFFLIDVENELVVSKCLETVIE